MISIHALTKRATHLDECFYRNVNISIHALTKRATSVCLFCCLKFKNFNPRSHEESDSGLILFVYLHFYFNPRSHEESDLISLQKQHKDFIFQSTLSRRERPLPALIYDKKRVISIHALTKRATLKMLEL